MIIQASVKSKAFKKGWDKDKKYGLRELCGHLALDCTNEADAALLTALWRHVFSHDEKEAKGKIIVLDKDGKEVMKYWHGDK